MTRLIAPFLVTVLLAGACSSADSPRTDSPRNDSPSAAVAPECPPGWDRALRAWETAGFSGTVAVSTRGDFDCLAAYGTADEATGRSNTVDTVFSIGSVSKAFTAAAIFHLIDAGTLSLSDRAGDLVAGLSGPAADATAEQLLLHTSGLTGSHGDDHEPLDRDAAVTAISGLDQAFESGSDYLYSNAGYTLLALIIEEASGTSYREYVATRILPQSDGEVAGGFWDGEPAAPGPPAVGYLEDGTTTEMGDFAGPHWALSGNGDLAMTMRDLATWTYALFTGRIVSPDSTAAIASPGVRQDDGRTAETPGWVAIDASVFGVPVLAAAGGGGDIGHNAVVVWLPKAKRVVAIASNTPDITAEDLLQAVGPSIAAGDPLPTPDPVRGVDPDAVTDIAGKYRLDTGGTLSVAARDDRLAISASDADAVGALLPLPAGVAARDVRAHEKGVLSLLAGGTREGRRERRNVESSIGPIEEVRPMGTIVADGELRTYVIVRSSSAAMRLWYALDEAGGVAAAYGPTKPPMLLFVPSGRCCYRPEDPTGTAPDVTVEFDTDGMTLSSPTGSVDARRLG